MTRLCTTCCYAKDRGEFSVTQWNSKRDSRRCKECILVGNSTKMTGEMFMLLDLPTDARITISQFIEGDNGVCAFLIGVLAGTELGAEHLETTMSDILRQDRVSALCQKYHRSFIKDSMRWEETLLRTDSSQERANNQEQQIKMIADKLECLRAEKDHQIRVRTRELIEMKEKYHVMKNQLMAQMETNNKLRKQLSKNDNDGLVEYVD